MKDYLLIAAIVAMVLWLMVIRLSPLCWWFFW
jgi:hypothetical protein